MDPDQLASSEVSWSGSTLFTKEFISGFILFSSFCTVSAQYYISKFSLDKYIMVISCPWASININISLPHYHMTSGVGVN